MRDRTASRRRTPQVLAALLAAGLAAVVPSATTSPVRPVALVLAVALSAVAVRSRSSAVRQAVLLVDLLVVAVTVEVLGLWPVPAAIAVVLAWWLGGRGVEEHRWSPWLRHGRWTPELPWLVAGTVVVTAGALLAWQRLADGTLPQDYLDAAAGRPWALIVLGGVAFSLVNAAVEEVVFRGVLLSALSAVLGVTAAVVLQAVAFGVLHLNGVPSGPAGMAMAGAWGLLLGVMRVRSRGLLAPYVTHVAADATIVLLVLPTLTA